MGQFGVRRSVTRLGLLLDLPVHHGRDGGLFERMARLAESAENAGFDSLWVNDRTGDPHASEPDDGYGFEAYSLLGALATRTHKVRLGALPRDMDRRAPSILAKIVTGIDVISHGRSVATIGSALGPGAPGEPGEPDGPGGSDGPGRMHAHVARLTEGLRVCRAVLDEQGIDFSGTVYDVHGALNRPRPLQAGGVPLALFVHDSYPLRPELLASGARYVDAVLIQGDASVVAPAAETVRAAVRLHDGPSDSVGSVDSVDSVDSVKVIQVLGPAVLHPPAARSGTDVDTGQLASALAPDADGCILSVGIDASPEWIRQVGHRLEVEIQGVSAGASRTGC